VGMVFFALHNDRHSPWTFVMKVTWANFYCFLAWYA
jgi:hypothetical protein